MMIKPRNTLIKNLTRWLRCQWTCSLRLRYEKEVRTTSQTRAQSQLFKVAAGNVRPGMLFQFHFRLFSWHPGTAVPVFGYCDSFFWWHQVSVLMQPPPLLSLFPGYRLAVQTHCQLYTALWQFSGSVPSTWRVFNSTILNLSTVQQACKVIGCSVICADPNQNQLPDVRSSRF